MKRPVLRLFPLFMAGAVVLAGGAAQAQPRVAVLAFGGDGDDAVHGSISRGLRRGYEVVHGDLVLDACDALGIAMSRGRNLARCAARAQVVAVVGGAVAGGVFKYAIYSAKSGQVVKSGSVPCRRRLSGRSLSRALSAIRGAISRVPGGRTRSSRPSPAPTPAPADGGDDLTFDPEEVTQDGQRSDLDEDPLSDEPAMTNTDGEMNFDPNAGDDGDDEDNQEFSPSGGKKGAFDWWSKVEIILGFGTWMRSFSLNDPAEVYKLSSSGAVVKDSSGNPVKLIGHPGYESGAAFALKVGALVRPGAFFSDGVPSWFYLRLHYQTTLGLKSVIAAKRQELTTTQDEFAMDVGLDYRFWDAPTAPHATGGLGFGISRFSIDWIDPVTTLTDTNNRMPNTSYAFFMSKVGARWPFLKYVGSHLNFDFRVTGGAGQVEDERFWYGPSSTNGLCLGIGLDGKYIISEKVGIVAAVDYTYTRYFYAFSEAQARMQSNKLEAQKQSPNNEKMLRVAGGALDVLHGIIVSVGYSY